MNYNEPIKVPLKYIAKSQFKLYLDNKTCSFLGRKGELMEIGFFTRFGRETHIADYYSYVRDIKRVNPAELFYNARKHFVEYEMIPDTMTSYSWLIMPLLRHCIINEYRYNHINKRYSEIIAPLHPNLLEFFSGYTFAHQMYERIKQFMSETTNPLVCAIIDIKNWFREPDGMHTCINHCTLIHLVLKLVPEDEKNQLYYFRSIINTEVNERKIIEEYGEDRMKRFQRGLLCDVDENVVNKYKTQSLSSKLMNGLSKPQKEYEKYKLSSRISLLKSMDIPIHYMGSLLCTMRKWYQYIISDIDKTQEQLKAPWTETKWHAGYSKYWRCDQDFNFDSGKYDINPNKSIRFIINSPRNVFLREKENVVKNLNDVVNFCKEIITEDDLDQRYIGVFVKVDKSGIYDPSILYYQLFLGNPFITLIDEVSRILLLHGKYNTNTVMANLTTIDNFVELRDIKTAKSNIKPTKALVYTLKYTENTIEHESRL